MNLQNFLATSISEAATELEAAFLNLPDDKRNWSAGGQARTALDMVAEVTLLNGASADMIEERQGMADFDPEEFNQSKAEFYGDWAELQKLLHDNTARVAAVVGALSDNDFDIEVQMPCGPINIAQMADYPRWNAKYHEGQINFIASMLG